MDAIALSLNDPKSRQALDIQAIINQSELNGSPRVPGGNTVADSLVISPLAREMQNMSESIQNSENRLKDIFKEIENDLRIQLIQALFGDEETAPPDRISAKAQEILDQNREAVLAANREAMSGQGIRFEATHISAEKFQAEIVMEDGGRARIEFTRIEVQRIQGTSDQPQTQAADPLVLDLDGDGLELTSVENGVEFDLTGDGKKEKTAFAAPDDGMLAADWNKNGVIDSGLELFGDQRGAANGFSELAKYDENKDAMITEKDSIYKDLFIWREMNGDGISQANELFGLANFGINSISLNFQNTDMNDAGNRISQISTYQNTAGQNRLIGDAWLNYIA